MRRRVFNDRIDFRPCLFGCAAEMNCKDVAGRNVTEEIEQLISFFAFSSRIKFIWIMHDSTRGN